MGIRIGEEGGGTYGQVGGVVEWDGSASVGLSGSRFGRCLRPRRGAMSARWGPSEDPNYMVVGILCLQRSIKESMSLKSRTNRNAGLLMWL